MKTTVGIIYSLVEDFEINIIATDDKTGDTMFFSPLSRQYLDYHRFEELMQAEVYQMHHRPDGLTLEISWNELAWDE